MKLWSAIRLNKLVAILANNNANIIFSHFDAMRLRECDFKHARNTKSQLARNILHSAMNVNQLCKNIHNTS